MAKGDDAVLKKKNKVLRKRIRGKESVSARVAAIIASKRRRKSGKRRICEGMCYSLPTPEDPFNDRNDPKLKKCKKAALLNKVDAKSEESEDILPEVPGGNYDGSINSCPSKFLCICLNAIQNAWIKESTFDESVDEPLLASRLCTDFWKCYASGSDIWDKSGDLASKKQIAWVVSTASDIITVKEKDGIVTQTPFLLYLVDCQERAAKVRSVCKPLKELGVHAISVHPGASLLHQFRGLKSCEPEFLIATPERLLDLILIRAIDISNVSLLVVDGLDCFISSGCEGTIKSIRQFISGDPQTIIFSGSSKRASIGLAQSLIREPVCKLPRLRIN